MRVLHLTYWYPNEDQPQAGIFIKNHIDGLNQHCQNDHYHVQVIESKDFLKKSVTKNSIIYKSRFAKYYKIQERLTLKGLKEIFKKLKDQHYDIINIHIATPIGRHLDFIEKETNLPIVITEHWTAYYRYFGLEKNHTGLQRMKDIFFKNIKLLTVSEALGEDIKRFSGNNELNYEVVPNIISTAIFEYKPIENQGVSFFMLTNWSPEKNPLSLLKSFQRLTNKAQLRIGGDGILLAQMKDFVKQNGMDDQVTFLGRLSPENAAKEFQKATAFVHAAFYETFSVVCAEALCCGCPVIASNIPAITEYLDLKSGALVNDFEETDSEKIEDAWFNVLNKFEASQFNRKDISERFSKKFGHQKVSQVYYNLLKEYAQ